MLKQNVMHFHSHQHRKQFIRATGSYRDEYISKVRDGIAHPAAAYAAKRAKNEEDFNKTNLEKPKESTCPAKPMSSNTLVSYAIQPEEKGNGRKNRKYFWLFQLSKFPSRFRFLATISISGHKYDLAKDLDF